MSETKKKFCRPPNSKKIYKPLKYNIKCPVINFQLHRTGITTFRVDLRQKNPKKGAVRGGGVKRFKKVVSNSKTRFKLRRSRKSKISTFGNLWSKNISGSRRTSQRPQNNNRSIIEEVMTILLTPNFFFFFFFLSNLCLF